MWARQTENMQSRSFYVCLCLRLSVSREAVFFSSMRDTWRDSEKEQNKISEKNMMTEKTKFYFLLYINPRMLVWGYFCFHCADEYKIGHQDWAVVGRLIDYIFDIIMKCEISKKVSHAFVPHKAVVVCKKVCRWRTPERHRYGFTLTHLRSRLSYQIKKKHTRFNLLKLKFSHPGFTDKWNFF